MTMTEPIENPPTTPWIGEWKVRLQEQLSRLGFGNLEEFLHANQGAGYVSLAKMLDDANVSAMQLYGEQIRRGYQTGNVRCVATDCLVRFLNEYIPRGWNTGRHFQHRSASAFASWSTSITAIANSDTRIERRLKLVYDKLEAMPLPIGWLPKDNSDAWITEAFEKGWPIAE